jgi:predicted dehydrogenase
MLNAAIVGLGRWGQHLVDCVHESSGIIRFVAGATRTVAKVDGYGRAKGLRLYDAYEKVLADSEVEAVVLATPHTQHVQQVIAAAQAGKHVFTEKPFALTAASADAAVRACSLAGVTLAVGFNWRFQPGLQTLRQMLTNGSLGQLLHLEGNFCGPSVYRFSPAHWRHAREEGPAGGMTGRGVHVLDAFLYLAGRVSSVYAQSFRRVLDTGIDDTTSILFRFLNGATGYLGTVIATAETWRLQVLASNGWGEFGDVEHLTTWQMKLCHVDPANPPAHPQQPQVLAFGPVSTERLELEHFAKAALERRPLAVAGGDEVHGVAVFEAILKSSTSGQPVKVAPVETTLSEPSPSPLGRA